MRSGLASYTVTAPLPVLVWILGAGERRDHVVRIGGHSDNMIVAELDQCVTRGTACLMQRTWDGLTRTGFPVASSVNLWNSTRMTTLHEGGARMRHWQTLRAAS